MKTVVDIQKIIARTSNQYKTPYANTKYNGSLHIWMIAADKAAKDVHHELYHTRNIHEFCPKYYEYIGYLKKQKDFKPVTMTQARFINWLLENEALLPRFGVLPFDSILSFIKS